MAVKKHGEADTFDPTDLSMEEADAQVYQQPERRISTALTSIRVLQGGGLTIGGFTMTRSGLKISENVSDDDWERVGGIIVDMGKSIQWLLGDWLAFGVEREYGATYDKVAQMTGYEVPTLRNMVYVCQNVNLSLRSDKLKFGHHQLVAPLAPHEQVDWLNKAEVGKWTISQLRKAIDDAKDGDPPAPPTPRDMLLDHIQASSATANRLIVKAIQDPKTKPQALRLIAEQMQYLQNLIKQLGG